MASSSHNNLDESFDQIFDDTFDQIVDQHFDQTFENLMVHGDKEEARKKRKKNEPTSKEIEKKVIYVYGTIISVKLRRILKIFSDDGLE